MGSQGGSPLCADHDGGGSFVRTIGSVDEGIGITEVMLHQLYKRRIPVLGFHMLVEVAQADDGHACGALALDMAAGMWRYFPCKAVIIATGGTSQLYETSSGPVINTGDGIAIALRAGARLVDIEFMQFIPISFVYPPSARGYTLTEPAHYGMRHYDPNADAAHLLNNQGERFVLKHDPVRREVVRGTYSLAPSCWKSSRAGEPRKEGYSWCRTPGSSNRS